MTARSPADDMAGAELARDRLARLQRLAELLAAQEEALRAGDLEAAQALSNAALELQEEIGVAVEATGPRGPGPDPGAEQAADLLRAALASNERVRGRLRALRQEVAVELHRTARGRPDGASYLRAAAPERRERLDVRL